MSHAPSPSVASLKAAAPLAQLRLRAQELLDAAADDDVCEGFPRRAIELLRDTDCLAAVLPPEHGGLGLGWARGSADVLLDVLRAIGGVHLSAARLFEGHVNAFQLLWMFGSTSQRKELCEYVRAGELLGVWNAPSPAGPLQLESTRSGTLRLRGTKAYASGAGGIRRPLVTANHAELGFLIVWPDLQYSVGDAQEWQMHGMRASITRSVNFDGVVHDDQVFGTSQDYHRQPYFSGGAWRFLAAQLGAGEALVESMRKDLLTRRRAEDIHQQGRMAQCAMALETARKWVRDVAHEMDEPRCDIEHVVQHANAGRLVVERALLDVIEHVHRGVGLASFSRRVPIERIARDLATYLRQPAPDALLSAIGEMAFDHPRPGLLAASYDSE
jgi:alkylation response protein AidB-like acyl-CoA dehydrogenase